MTEFIIGEKKQNCYYITLTRPDKRNAVTIDMITGLCRMAEEAALDRDIRAIIIKGEGKIFSAGVDYMSLGAEVGAYLGDAGAGGVPFRALIFKFQQYLNRLEAIEVPLICAMHGKVLGLGVEIALACDMRLMSDDCAWGLPELRLGLIADLGGTTRLSKFIGQTRALEILMTGNDYSAQQALDWGLVNYIYPPDQLIAAAERLAQDISKCAPLAVGAVKKIIKRGEGVDLMTQLDMEVNLNSILMGTEDFQEGIAALMEKREPVWKRR